MVTLLTEMIIEESRGDHDAQHQPHGSSLLELFPATGFAVFNVRKGCNKNNFCFLLIFEDIQHLCLSIHLY